MNTLIQLFISFAKIGLTSFGGLSMVPLITSEMTSHGWMTEEQISDLVAIAEMTPGPLGINCSTFAGMHAAGALGAVAACLGVLTPTLTICFFVAVFFEKFRDNPYLSHALVGIRPASMALILGVMISLALTNYVGENGISLISVAIGLLDLFCMVKLKWPAWAAIIMSAVSGALLL